MVYLRAVGQEADSFSRSRYPRAAGECCRGEGSARAASSRSRSVRGRPALVSSLFINLLAGYLPAQRAGRARDGGGDPCLDRFPLCALLLVGVHDVGHVPEIQGVRCLRLRAPLQARGPALAAPPAAAGAGRAARLASCRDSSPLPRAQTSGWCGRPPRPAGWSTTQRRGVRATGGGDRKEDLMRRGGSGHGQRSGRIRAVRKRIWPPMVDFPASTWPINTRLTCSLRWVSGWGLGTHDSWQEGAGAVRGPPAGRRALQKHGQCSSGHIS